MTKQPILLGLLLLVVAFASAGRADDVSDAQARLDAKARAAATQPVDVAALRRMIANLEQENADLKRANKELTKKVAEYKKAEDAAKAVAVKQAVVAATPPAEGTSKANAAAYMAKNGYKLTSTLVDTYNDQQTWSKAADGIVYRFTIRYDSGGNVFESSQSTSDLKDP